MSAGDIQHESLRSSRLSVPDLRRGNQGDKALDRHLAPPTTARNIPSIDQQRTHHPHGACENQAAPHAEEQGRPALPQHPSAGRRVVPGLLRVRLTSGHGREKPFEKLWAYSSANCYAPRARERDFSLSDTAARMYVGIPLRKTARQSSCARTARTRISTTCSATGYRSEAIWMRSR
jgi:hypothetical protein